MAIHQHIDEHCLQGRFAVRALTRNTTSQAAKELSKLPDVQVVRADLQDRNSLVQVCCSPA